MGPGADEAGLRKAVSELDLTPWLRHWKLGQPAMPQWLVGMLMTSLSLAGPSATTAGLTYSMHPL